MDVLFTHSYFLRFDSKEFKTMMPYAPLGTLYAAAYARQRGHSVGLADSMLAEDERHIVPFLERERPRIFVIYDDDFNYLTKMCLSRMRDAAFTMSRIAKQFGCIVIAHGSDSADHLQKYFSHGVDYVISGEGEETLIETLDALLRKNKSLRSIGGLAYVNDAAIHCNEPRRVRSDLDSLPFPAWDLVDVEQYRRKWRQRHGYYSVNMVTTRGCPFHCNWCAKPIYGQVYNSRTPDNVVSEMLWLKQNLKPDHVWFCDDIFGLKPGWIEEFAGRVKEQNAFIPFKCLARVDLLLKGKAVEALRDAGCKTVWVGAESGSQKILDAMDKGTTVSQIIEASARMKRNGIRVGFFLQFGYPGETREDIDLTIKMLKQCMPDEIGISVSYPLPGTKFYDRVKSQLGEKQNWIESADLDLMYRGAFSADYYRTLHRVTHKKFRIWQSLNLVGSLLKRPADLRLHDLRRIAAGAYHSITLPSLQFQLYRRSS